MVKKSITENPSRESHDVEDHAKLPTMEKTMTQGPFRREMA